MKFFVIITSIKLNLYKILLMRRFIFFIFIYLFSINTIQSQQDFQKGEIIIQLLEDHSINEILNDFQSFRGETTYISLKKQLSEQMRYYLLHYNNPSVDEYEILDAMIEHPATVNAQLNYFLSFRKIPNDTLFPFQWQYLNDGSNGGVEDADIDMELAWDITTGGATMNGDSIVIAIVDDGFDITHPDFGDNLWINKQEIPNNGQDDDNNGYIDDIMGWNAYEDNGDITDNGWGGSHGTSVAGVVGAKGNNTTGVSGVNWDVKLMIVAGGGSTQSDALAAYAYPYSMRKLYNESNGNKGAYIVGINSSWGRDFGKPSDAPLWCAMYDSMGMQGILNVGATANINVDVEIDGDLPSRCVSNYLVIVTNMDKNDMKVSNAAYGKNSVDLGAPGRNIYTVESGTLRYSYFGGTSAASPHVAGTIGLLYAAACDKVFKMEEKNPDSAVLLMKEFILNGVDKKAGLENTTSSGGRLNIYNSLMEMDKYCKGISVKEPFKTEINILYLYPNPAMEIIRLKLYTSETADYEIAILDQTGKKVIINKDIRLQTGYYNFHFDISELNNGLYYMEVINKNKNTRTGSKFMKM